MGYSKLSPSKSGGTSLRARGDPDNPDPISAPPRNPRRRLIILFIVVALALILVASVSAALVVGLRTKASGHGTGLKPTQAISKTCSRTRFPALCIDSLLNFPGSMIASEPDLVHISFNMTLQHLNKALYISSSLGYVQMDPLARSAYDDCLELLDGSVDAISQSLYTVAPPPDGGSGGGGNTHDVMTWLSTALTNQDTCLEGLDGVNGDIKNQLADRLKDLSELVSNCLAIYAATDSDDFSGVPVQNKRRRLLGIDRDRDQDRDRNPQEYPEKSKLEEKIDFPTWLDKRDRELLDMPLSAVQADVVVSKSGNGTYKTIAEAIKKAPEHGSRRFIIYIKAGKYEEDNLKVGRKKVNLMFIGDGKGATVITGGKSVADKITTFHTATFAATGAGFIARDITFENYAGPSKHQAVALRVGADHSVVYRCSIIGYQDTLYVHSNRQFFRECDIYGTVDFIFGNAAVVIQKCNINARKPMPQQKNTITAQNRKDPNQNTGISIHACRIQATPELEASKGSFPTYLGRPWKTYSRVVYMLSYMGDHINPRGWLEWNGNFALDTLYYGEYMNSGPGAALGQRVKWKGYRVITSTTEASRFTVAQFIFGSAWLPSTGVAFLAGLSE